MKRCTLCGIEKSKTEFHKRAASKDGLQSKCKECHKLYFKGLSPAEKMERGKKAKKWRADNSEKHTKSRRRYKLKIMYGLTPEDWNILYEEQGGCCAVCGTHQSKLKKTLNVDHNHETGEIRKLLCGLCNKALGLLKENPVIIRSLADYIDKYIV